MNMEIALILAHVCLICAGAFKLYEKTINVSITRAKYLKHRKVYTLKNSVGNNLKRVLRVHGISYKIVLNIIYKNT